MCEKMLFTKQEAEHALHVNSRIAKPYRKKRRAYYCHHCNGWHLTSQPDKNINPITEVELIYKEQWLKLQNQT